MDPDYGYMLSGYTVNGSVNILRYMQNQEASGILHSSETRRQYREKLLNMTMYSYFTLLSFVRHVAETDYIPRRRYDWYILRESCGELRKMLREVFPTYTYTEKIEQYFLVKNHTDVMFTEPWVTFDEYIENGCRELSWDFETLLMSKESMKFSKEGIRIWDI